MKYTKMDFNTWFGKLVHEENIAMLEDLFIYDEYDLTIGGATVHDAISHNCLQSSQWLLEHFCPIGRFDWYTADEWDTLLAILQPLGYISTLRDINFLLAWPGL